MLPGGSDGGIAGDGVQGRGAASGVTWVTRVS